MRVAFVRIKSEPQNFDLVKDATELHVALRHYKHGMVLLSGKLSGELEVECFRCSQSLVIMIDEKIEFLLSEDMCDASKSELDIVEVFDQYIDLDEIFHSEIELVKSDYYSCENCKQQ